ncbi:MAG TPA: FixH family protein [Woeseiaceae bacterium]|nr:FixH family protein [Woeseiaceae bacterium]
MTFDSIGHYSFIVALLLTAFPTSGFAHGGVVTEDDRCVINIGYLTAHFKIYVPAKTQHKDYCEDIPVSGESIFVMEYQHDGLSNAAIDFRIIRNVTGKGQYARLQDVEAIGDLDSVTIRHEPPTVVPDVYTLLQDFTDDGEYIGIVTASTADEAKTYTAVFPFTVGNTGIGVWPWFVAGVIFLQLNFWYWNRRRRQSTAAALVLATCCLVSAHAHADEQTWTSDNGHFSVKFESELDPVVINRMHAWTLSIDDRKGNPVQGATVTMQGGMPLHNHGLPTEPVVFALQEAGQYRVEGIRFHMQGYWEIRLSIDDKNHRDNVTIALEL